LLRLGQAKEIAVRAKVETGGELPRRRRKSHMHRLVIQQRADALPIAVK